LWKSGVLVVIDVETMRNDPDIKKLLRALGFDRIPNLPVEFSTAVLPAIAVMTGPTWAPKVCGRLTGYLPQAELFGDLAEIDARFDPDRFGSRAVCKP
jgi:hypothetical protein